MPDPGVVVVVQIVTVNEFLSNVVHGLKIMQIQQSALEKLKEIFNRPFPKFSTLKNYIHICLLKFAVSYVNLST